MAFEIFTFVMKYLELAFLREFMISSSDLDVKHL
jgi:hypothetical protein